MAGWNRQVRLQQIDRPVALGLDGAGLRQKGAIGVPMNRRRAVIRERRFGGRQGADPALHEIGNRGAQTPCCLAECALQPEAGAALTGGIVLAQHETFAVEGETDVGAGREVATRRLGRGHVKLRPTGHKGRRDKGFWGVKPERGGAH